MNLFILIATVRLSDFASLESKTLSQNPIQNDIQTLQKIEKEIEDLKRIEKRTRSEFINTLTNKPSELELYSNAVDYIINLSDETFEQTFIQNIYEHNIVIDNLLVMKNQEILDKKLQELNKQIKEKEGELKSFKETI